MRPAVIAIIILALTRVAVADDINGAREHYRKGLSAYGLGKYGEAAEEYEKAFAATPDPALLYNAAQAHRIAGHKERALELYQSYLRLFSDADNRADVLSHIAALQAAIQSKPPSAERAAPPKPNPEPQASPPAAKAPIRTSQRSLAATASLTAAAAPSPARRPGRRLAIGLGVTGTIVAAGLALGLGFGLAPAQDPSASLGAVHVK
jgi:tetratricopeptide (TPR) repeat protein